MSKTLLIFRHEFLRTVRRTGFIILTLSLPVLALLGIGIYRIASGIVRPSAEITRMGYVDQAGGFDQFTTQVRTMLVRYDTQEAAVQSLVNKDIREFFVIPSDFISTGTIDVYSMQRQLSASTGTTAVIQNFISSNLLAGKVPADVAARVQTPLNLVTTTLTSTGAVAPQQANYASIIIPGIFSLLLGLALIFTSTYVIQSLSEEKENRLMEILISSVSTRQLLAGKVLGLGAAGLAEVTVWVISFPLLLQLASSFLGGIVATLHVPVYFWFLGVVYFILGYLLFAVLSACVASVTSSLQEAQQLAGLYTLFNVAPLWFLSLILLFPDSPAWVVFSIFPFSAPVLMMIRLGLFGVPAWQLAASIAVMAGCVVAGLLLAAKLLRTYLLMYGKRPGIGAIVRSLRGA